MSTLFLEQFSTKFALILCEHIKCVAINNVEVDTQPYWLKLSFTEARLGKMRQPFLSNLLVKWQICVVEGCLIFLFAELVTFLMHNSHFYVAYVVLNEVSELNLFLGMDLGICKADKQGQAWISLYPLERASFQKMALVEAAASKLYIFVQSNASSLRLLLSGL